MSIGAIVVVAVVVLLVVTVIAIYNELIGLRNRIKNAWSQIDVQLKRRHDLVPNLVETVKGYAAHERQALEAVVAARGNAVSASGVAAISRAESELSGALGRLLAVVEAYPDLKANQNFLSLQEELSSTENRIAFARQAYNDQVMDYNTKRESFPVNTIAGMFNFAAADHLVIENPAERETPRVSF
ncbi:MAG: LemA family protein [Deltaproteobacteria bacterium]|nr:LemA family protein [Deltaproteobacteria bacterium]